MKILHVTSSGFEEGGIENYLMLTRPLMQERGHEVRILASNARPDLKHFNDYSYAVPTSKLSYIFNFSAYKELRRAIKEYEPHVVHVHTIGHASPSVLFALKNQPAIFTIHGPDGFTTSLLPWVLPVSDFKNTDRTFGDLRLTGKVRYVYYRYFLAPLYWLGCKNIDLFITMSHYMQKLMQNDGIKNTYIPLGTSLFPYVPFSKQHTPHILAYAGRLEWFKGVEYLLNALPEVLERYPDVRLYIAGDGRERMALERLAAVLDLQPQVVFLGHLDRPRLESLYQQTSVVVMPSVWEEAFGLVGIEAMSVGRPVIGSRVGGIPEWLTDGENGFLVPPKDPDAIARALIKIFEDENELCAMGARARKTAEQFDILVHADSMEKIYQQVAEQKQYQL